MFLILSSSSDLVDDDIIILHILEYLVLDPALIIAEVAKDKAEEAEDVASEKRNDPKLRAKGEQKGDKI